ncbi:MAG: MarR family winged helix-turn-helix transcriptional regulator [Vulcanimicrobiaceae bacterium]
MEMHREPENCACLNLRAATRFLTRRYDEIMAPSGLLSTQYSMLTFIAEHSSCGVSELADWLVMDVSTATRNLRPLISSGYVTMRSGVTDKRRREIRITAKGRRALDAARPLWNSAQDEVARQLGSQRYKQLLELLSDLRQ